MKYYLYAVIERADGSLMRQRVRKMNEDNTTTEDIRRILNNYVKMLGTGYYLIDWYFDR